MQIGDRIWASDAGELRVLSGGEQEPSGGKIMGVIRDVREPEEESVVELDPGEENVNGVLITLRILKAQLQEGTTI